MSTKGKGFLIKIKLLVDTQRRNHALLLASLGAQLVRHLEPNFHRVALARVDVVKKHVLLHAILLEWRHITARLRSELECVGLEWFS